METIKYFEFIDFDFAVTDYNYEFKFNIYKNKLTKGKIYKIDIIDYNSYSDYSTIEDDGNKNTFRKNSKYFSWFKDVTVIVERKLKLEKLNEIN